MRARCIESLLVALGMLSISALGDRVHAQPQERLIVVISDLHFGVGRVGGDWHPFEDFRWADEFEGFLEEIHKRGDGRTTLVLNGDTFELWQSLQQFSATPDCNYEDRNLGCQLSEARTRLERAIGQHQRELSALGRFAMRADNRVVIVPGNHDAALLWPTLADDVIAAIGGGNRVSVSASGSWRSDDGRVFAEHGHQIGEDLNTFCQAPLPCTWPQPFLPGPVAGAQHMAKPWGEQFVQSFYNRYEKAYPIIDNLASEALGVRYGIAAEGAGGVVAGILRFVRFLLTQESWSQYIQLLGEGDRTPDWDVAKAREVDPRKFLIESIPFDDPLREAAMKDADPVASLSDDEIRAICERRAIVRAEPPPERTTEIVPCEGGPPALRGIKEYLLGARDQIFRVHLESRRAVPSVGSFLVFVYSHTHKAEEAFSPFDDPSVPVKPTWFPLVLNSGAWQRVVSERQLKALMKKRGLTAGEVLRLRPEALPACYSAILIDERVRPLDPVLRWWHHLPDGRWELSASLAAPECPETGQKSGKN